MIGQILAGRYRIVQVLGAGGFGETYITADLHLPGEPECVLKHLKPATNDLAVLDIARKLFQKEAETLQQLGNHDRIPRLLAYFEEKKEFYLVQELVRGHTLSRELISGQKWTESAVRRMLREVLTILDFVHSQGVIHRDVKPENIMRRDSDGHLVLIDFGAIKQVRNQPLNMGTTPQTVAIGTPGYMSPEQARGNPRPSSDLYALGVIGIQAVSGKNPSELIEDDATGELQWQQFAQASPLLIAHLSEMTRYHFRDRFITASAALQALNEIESGDLTSPLPSNPLPSNPLPTTANHTAATYVVEPVQPPPQPAPQQKQQDPRLTPPAKGNTLGKLVGMLAIMGVSGTGGYTGWSMFKSSQYESALASTQCRLAAPTKGGNTTKMRLSPDRNASIIANIQAGEKFLALQEQDAFIEIQQHSGQRGWVFRDQIDLCIKPQPTVTPQVNKPSPSLKPSPVVTTPTTTIAPSSPPVSTITPTPLATNSPSPSNIPKPPSPILPPVPSIELPKPVIVPTPNLPKPPTPVIIPTPEVSPSHPQNTNTP
jgi:serine/threonine protein kinase